MRRGRARARSSSCCARSPTSTPTRRRSRRAGLRPFVVGGRGYWTQQQVEDLIRLLGVVANPLEDEYLFGALASFANGVSPDALWLLRRAATSEDGLVDNVWPLVSWRYGDGREPAIHTTMAGVDRAEDARRLERFCAHPRRVCAPRRPLLTLEELIERTMTAFGYDLGLIARERRRRADGERPQADAPGRATTRRTRAATSAGFLALAAEQHPSRRARGHGRGPGRGPRRSAGDDRARRKGAASSTWSPSRTSGATSTRATVTPTSRSAGRAPTARAGSGCASRSLPAGRSGSGSSSTSTPPRARPRPRRGAGSSTWPRLGPATA